LWKDACFLNFVYCNNKKGLFMLYLYYFKIFLLCAFVWNLLSFFFSYYIFSSPEHKVLMVSYCDRTLSVVRRRASCGVRHA